MKNKLLKSEQIYGLAFLLVAILTGALTGYWSWSFVLWSLVYIVWKWIELYYFYNWYKNGANIKDAPLTTGIWQELCALVIQNKKRNLKVEQKNKYLIKQFETTAQALPYATILLNNKFEVTWVNRSSQEILGVIQGHDERKKIQSILTDSTFATLLAQSDDRREIKIIHPNDKHKKVQIRLVKLSKKRHLLVARDISEQESLRKSRKAFVDNASHELRTPLTVITGYLEMMYGSNEISGQWTMAIEQAMQQSQRMENIIDDMLKLSSIEHQRYLESNDENINMPALLNRLFNDVKNSSKAKHHQFYANIDSMLHIKGNEKELVSICLNLLNNAVIHNQVDTKISVRWYREAGKACLWVEDNGIGIKPEHRSHLTERFYRVDNSRDKNTSSTGLGLAIVKQVCDNHGAVLSIESDGKTGTCFKVVFPALRVL